MREVSKFLFLRSAIRRDAMFRLGKAWFTLRNAGHFVPPGGGVKEKGNTSSNIVDACPRPLIGQDLGSQAE